MKNIPLKLVLAATLLMVLLLDSPTPRALANEPWSEPINLSDSTGYSLSPSIAADIDGNVHVVWSDRSFGIFTVFHKMWNGIDWSDAAPLNQGFIGQESIAVDASGTLHVVYVDTDSQWIYHRSFDGDSWSTRNLVSDLAGSNGRVSLDVDHGNNLHVVWDNNYTVFHARLGDSGWSQPDAVAFNSYQPRFDVDNAGVVHVVWHERGTYSVQYRKWDGTSWSPVVTLSEGIAYSPDIATEGSGSVHVVWQTQGTGDIYYKQWDGINWSSAVNVSNAQYSASSPNVTVDASGNLQLVWEQVVGNWEIYYSQKRSGGWSLPEDISKNAETSAAPVIAVDGLGNLHSVWHGDTPSYARDIFYSTRVGGGDGPEPTPTNLALGKPVAASSIERVGLDAGLAVDGDPQTRWSSRHQVDPQWIYVDLGQVYNVEQIVLRWETAFAESFRIEFSDDAASWSTASFQEARNGEVDVIAVSGTTRYVRMYGLTRGHSGFGYSLYELEVYGQPAYEVPPPQVRPPEPTPGSDTLFFDDFDDGVDPAWAFMDGTSWQVVDGTLELSSPCGESVAGARIGNNLWTDYEVQFDFRGMAGSGKGFRFRWDESDSGHYSWSAHSLENDMILEGGGQTASFVPFPFQNGTWYRIKIRAEGDQIQVYVDDELLLNRIDEGAQRLSGGVGLFLRGGPVNCPVRVQYDNVIVNEIDVGEPRPEDFSIVVSVPEALTLNEKGWYAQNPIDLRITLTNNSGRAILVSYLKVTSSNLERLVVIDEFDRPEMWSVSLNERVVLDSGESIEHLWKIWVQPMSAQSILFEAEWVDLSATIPVQIARDAASMGVPSAQIHPVIVVNGLPGSLPNIKGEWVLDPAKETYETLLKQLRLVGYREGNSLFEFGYDWRQPTTESGSQLGNKIDEILASVRDSNIGYIQPYSVDIVAHSYGGLVSRAYIQGNYRADVNRLITLGTPHLGLPTAYRVAEGIEFDGFGGGQIEFIVKSLALKAGYCTVVVPCILCQPECHVTDTDIHRYIAEHIPSARDLFPASKYLDSDSGPGSYLVSHDDIGKINPFDRQMNEFLDTLNNEIDSLISRLGAQNVIVVAGDRPSSDESNIETYYKVEKPDAHDAPLWANGKIVSPEEDIIELNGDGLVPIESADLSRIDSRIQAFRVSVGDNDKTISHGNMPTQLQQTIVNILTGTQPFFNSGFPEPKLGPGGLAPGLIGLVVMSPVEVQVTDPAGRRVGIDFGTGDELNEIPDAFYGRFNNPNEPDFIFIPDAQDGVYIIDLIGIAEGDYEVRMVSLSNEGALLIHEIAGTTSPGTLHQHLLPLDKQSLPITPLSLEWYSPLTSSDQVLEVPDDAILPIEFAIRSSDGSFVADEAAVIYVVDSSDNSSAIATISAAGPGLHGDSDMVKIFPEDERYVANLHLDDYDFQAGKFYILGVLSYGEQLGTIGFAVRTNNPPTVDAGGPYTVPEGDVVTLAATGSDPDGDELTYAWDLDNDGSYETPGQSVTFSAAGLDGPSSYPVTVQVVDPDGLSATASTSVDVQNVVPTVTAGPDVVLDEGSIFSAAGSFSDSGPDAWTATVDYGDGSGAQPLAFNSDKTFALSHVYDDNGSYTVQIAVSDDDGGSGGDAVQVVVDNVAPTAVLANDSDVISEGESVTVAFSNQADPSSADTTASFSYTYDCDSDGTVDSSNDPEPTFVCSYPDNGVFTIRGRIQDKDGGFTDYTAGVSVNNEAPRVGSITAPIDPVAVNTPIDFTTDFTDPGVLDTHTAVWDWGDGSTTDGTVTEVDGSGSVAGSHTYSSAGVYTVQVTVTDNDNETGTSVHQFAVVYDPDGGFVTGGGWIESPEGAYTADPSLTGKATFGFVSKYQKGAQTPTGKTRFRFKVAGLSFYSENYDWLVVSGQSKAKYKGVGTINGGGNFGFMITAVDDNPDTFRIKIWDSDADDTVVYDNKLGISDDSHDGTELGGGNIKVHKQ